MRQTIARLTEDMKSAIRAINMPFVREADDPAYYKLRYDTITRVGKPYDTKRMKVKADFSSM